MDYAKVYRAIHLSNAGKNYGGKIRGAHCVTKLVERTKPRRLLDYGCGKGYQYLVERTHEQWGGLLPHCYDVGVRQLAARPTGQFDGIICCDVLEHIETQDVPSVLSDIFGFVSDRQDGESFVYLTITCTPSKEPPVDGRNIHLTQRSPEWWRAQLTRFIRDRLIIDARFETVDGRDY